MLPDRILDRKALLFNRRILGVIDEDKAPSGPDVEIIDAGGLYVTPGLIDVHSHGCAGEDATTSDGEGIRKMCRFVVENGVTSWLPTLVTSPLDMMSLAFERFRAQREESRGSEEDWGGAEILGVNMEGPFINPVRKGAHLPEYIKAPDADYALRYKDIIVLLTIAPEMEGGMEFVRRIVEESDIRLAMGHTAGTYDEAVAAFDAGVSEVTHLFNAMTGIHHRDPGTAGAALARHNVYCELIADTFHIHKGLFQLVADAKKDRLVLITDSLRATGLPDGEYDSGGQRVRVEGIRCLLPNGTIAGSVLRLNQGVRNLYENTDLPFEKAVAAASLNPARAIGVENRKGSIEPGKDADLVLMDSKCNVYKTFVRGVKCYEKQNSDYRL